MSTIYKFQDSETNITSSATSTGASGATMGATDALLIFNQGVLKTNQTTVGSISGLAQTQVISTSNSTSFFINLTPYGLSVLTATATTGVVGVLPAPPQAGLYKSLAIATATSTAWQVVCPSSSSSILTTGGSSGAVVPVQSIFLGQMGAYIDLQSVSTTAWVAVGRSVSATAIAYTTTTTT